MPFDPQCPLCVMFDYVFDYEFWGSLPPTTEISFSGSCDEAFITMQIYDDELSLTTFSVKSTQNGVDHGVDKDFTHNTSNPRSMWSLASRNRIISWLNDCTECHSNCNQKRNSDLRLPKRLIDVDPDGDISRHLTSEVKSEAEFEQLTLSIMPKVRILETSHLTNPRYLTLSHRWDPNPTILLTSEILSQFSQAIPTSLLDLPGSKTFREAIFVTRCLGYRYLWIDAICINQREKDDQGRDTKDELLSELAVMDQIYANGTCNISATGAQKAADGLFLDPLGPRMDEAINRMFSGYEQADKPTAISFCGDLGHFLNSAPLGTRGWVFQERLLSPRVIHFTNLQIYWECSTKQLSEHGHQTFYTARKHLEGIVRKADFAIPTKALSPVQDEMQIAWLEQWQVLTEKYSSLSLSHPEDRLPAISALARDFQVKRKLSPQDYYAGHWRPDLWFTLSWSVGDYQVGQNARYLAPSWSWVSVGCVIRAKLINPLPHMLFNVLDVSVSCENSDRFGKIKSGSIRLRCHLSQAVLDVKGPRWETDHCDLSVVGEQPLNSRRLRPRWDRPLRVALHRGIYRRVQSTDGFYHAHQSFRDRYLHGVTEKDTYAIVPTEVTTPHPDSQIAEATIKSIRDRDATLDLTWKGPHNSLPARGAHAILTRRGLPKSPVIIQGRGNFFDKLSEAVKKSKFLCVGQDFTTRLAHVRQEGDFVILEDDRAQIIRRSPVFDSQDPKTSGEVAILEALCKAKHVLGLQGAPPTAWPLRDVSVEFGLVKDGDGNKQPFREPGKSVEEDQSVYFEIKNSGKDRVYVSILDICLHHITLVNEDGTDVPAARTEIIGKDPGAKLKGIQVGWPPEVPRNKPIKVTAVLVLTKCQTDLKHLETGFPSRATSRKGEGTDLMEMVDQIVGGGDRPMSKIMAKVTNSGFGIWTYEYELVPKKE
ncbi:hypothetical protein CEP54_016152 [Fusarium duplospermum]|uniref:Heterokaryon incompatibility domain-containing protein n=1 Tax=Fusarium duplospermum TaxID=1325734 RepID=A0A428NHL8_9HYPO|nr:hypothetical protein CEP54_016152 [Fusarium duplospermum]